MGTDTHDLEVSAQADREHQLIDEGNQATLDQISDSHCFVDEAGTHRCNVGQALFLFAKRVFFLQSLSLKRNGNGHSKAGKDVRFKLPGGSSIEIPGTIFLRLFAYGMILLVLLKLYGVDVRGLIPGEQGNENAEVVATEPGG